jgi:putative transposase
MASRHRPDHGVLFHPTKPTIVFLTVCTRDREPWLASTAAHDLLLEVWKHVRAWIVGRYVLIPDHVHLFAAPGAMELPLDNWVRFWKSQFTKRSCFIRRAWPIDHWDTRLRNDESYENKWLYVKNNPERAGLVTMAEDWTFEGELNRLPWEELGLRFARR